MYECSFERTKPYHLLSLLWCPRSSCAAVDGLDNKDPKRARFTQYPVSCEPVANIYLALAPCWNIQRQTETTNSTVFICGSCWHKCCHWLCMIYICTLRYGHKYGTRQILTQFATLLFAEGIHSSINFYKQAPANWRNSQKSMWMC